MQSCAARHLLVVVVAFADESKQLFLLCVSDVLVLFFALFFVLVELVLLVQHFFYCLIWLFLQLYSLHQSFH